jgi:hypothetical protein
VGATVASGLVLGGGLGRADALGSADALGDGSTDACPTPDGRMSMAPNPPTMPPAIAIAIATRTSLLRLMRSIILARLTPEMPVV